jgi:hypothetical protein
MSDFYKRFETPLDKAVAKAVDQTNAAFLDLLERHSCPDHTGPVLQVDGSHRVQCRVCYADFGPIVLDPCRACGRRFIVPCTCDPDAHCECPDICLHCTYDQRSH